MNKFITAVVSGMVLMMYISILALVFYVYKYVHNVLVKYSDNDSIFLSGLFLFVIGFILIVYCVIGIINFIDINKDNHE
jgi:hypothetical protein